MQISAGRHSNKFSTPLAANAISHRKASTVVPPRRTSIHPPTNRRDAIGAPSTVAIIISSGAIPAQCLCTRNEECAGFPGNAS